MSKYVKAEPAAFRITWHGPKHRKPSQYYVPPPDNHPIHQYVGRVTVAWGHYEHQLTRIVQTLCGIRSPCLTAQMMGAGPRLNSIIALLSLREGSEPAFAKYKTKINDLMNNTFKPQESRNRIVHDAWYIDAFKDEPGQFRTWPRAKLEYGIHPVDRKEIEKTIADIERLTKRAKELFKAINADVAASHERQHPEDGQILREKPL